MPSGAYELPKAVMIPLIANPFATVGKKQYLPKLDT